MKLLLDTHVLIWWAENPEQIDSEARRHIFSDDSVVYVSVASAWEMGIKHTAGKLKTPKDLPEMLEANRFNVLDINLEHAMRAGMLPVHHRDPFDRMLVAQAQTEKLTLITHDRIFTKYDVKVMMA